MNQTLSNYVAIREAALAGPPPHKREEARYYLERSYRGGSSSRKPRTTKGTAMTDLEKQLKAICVRQSILEERLTQIENALRMIWPRDILMPQNLMTIKELADGFRKTAEELGASLAHDDAEILRIATQGKVADLDHYRRMNHYTQKEKPL